VLPGIAGYDTILANHRIEFERTLLERDRPYSDCHGNLQYRGAREDAEEAARLVGLDFKIDVLLDSRCRIIDLFAGDVVAEYRAGVKRAFEVYRIEHVPPADVCIVNANAKANEAGLAVNVGLDHIKPGGDVVLVNSCRSGTVNHYLCGMWGLDAKTALATSRNGAPLANAARQLVILSPYRQYNQTLAYGNPEQVHWAGTWPEVLALLDRPANTTATVFVEALTSFFADDFKQLD